MIFVTVGTNEFDELVKRIDDLAPALGEPVVCQIGRGAYAPRNCTSFDFAPTLDDQVRQARVVVGHGGLGTIMSAVRLGKPFVGISNPSRADQHQDQILGTFAERGHIVWCHSLDDLAASIEHAGQGDLVPYTEPPCYIPEAIRRFLAGASMVAPDSALQKAGR